MSPTDTNAAGETDVLNVALGDRGYEIHVGAGILAGAGRAVAELTGARRCVVVTDANVGPHYLTTVQASLEDAGVQPAAITLPAGEGTKDFAHLEGLIDELLARKIERATPLVALGGGVIGDLVGFAAAVTLRGLPYIQVPTTLLAQVDSSVGGKTAINTPRGKNLVGSFYQPRLVLADVDTLSTLPERELLAGYAEVVKYGLIRDKGFFAWCEENGRALIDGDAGARRKAVYESCAAKARVVAADETETGERALLNFGHTFAHALERETGFSEKLLHGEAVAMGMILAFDLSVRLGLCPAEDADRVRRHFEAAGLPTGPGGVAGVDWDTGQLLKHMSSDKKVRDGRVTFILSRGIGDAFITADVNPDDVRGVMDQAVAA